MTHTAVAPPEAVSTATDEQLEDRDQETQPTPKLAPDDVLVRPPAVPGPGNPSPDGARLAYLMVDPADVAGALTLWLQPLDGGEATALPLPFTPLIVPDPTGNTSADEGPQWSSDGATLALTGAHPANGRPAIWLLTVASGDARLLVDHPGADRAPRWSTDGTRIVFVSHRAGRDTVCIAPVDGAGPAITLSDGLHDDRDPAWSRDGSEIAFRRATPGHPTQGDIWVIKLATGVLKQVTNIPGKATSKPANRRAPKWAPNRSLIAFITDEKDYDAIAVVNPDNNAGWTLTDEPGDKTGVQWSPNGLRILYTRTLGPISNACARGTSASRSDVLDPGDGFAYAPRWTGDGRAVYAYGAPDKPVRHYTQEAKLDVERTQLSPAVAWDGPDAGLLKPSVYEVVTGDDTKLSGLLFRKSEVSGPTPAVVSLGDGPPRRQEAALNLLHQALALAGIAVYAPNLRGTPGNGRAITDGLQTFAAQEIEAADLADVATALRGLPDLLGDRIAITGRGFGATLALIVASSRPGHYATVVAVDPIVDWGRELDAAPEPWRTWLIRQLGLPALDAGPYALRTPETFAGLLGLLDVPVLLIGTESAPAGRAVQLDAFAALLTEIEIPFARATAQTNADVARLTLDHLLTGPVHRDVVPAPAEIPTELPVPAEESIALEDAIPIVPVEPMVAAATAEPTAEPAPVPPPAEDASALADAGAPQPPPAPANGHAPGSATKPDDV